MENYFESYQRVLNSTPERMLVFLKMRGPQPASALSKAFEITNEGARLHLKKLMDDGFVKSEKVSKGVGRPTVFYSLTEKGLERFPNTHAELTVQLLTSVKNVLGQDALDQLIEAREMASMERYGEALKNIDDVEEKLDRLVQIRSEEGYMAEWEKVDNGYVLVENHCPICAAATECHGFCRAELNTFRMALGENVQVDRTDHIISGARRCSYKVTTTEE